MSNLGQPIEKFQSDFFCANVNSLLHVVVVVIKVYLKVCNICGLPHCLWCSSLTLYPRFRFYFPLFLCMVLYNNLRNKEPFTKYTLSRKALHVTTIKIMNSNI